MSGKDQFGRFTASNSFGSVERRSTGLRDCLNKVSQKQFKGIISNLIRIASQDKSPNAAIKAAEVLFDRLLGKLTDKIEIKQKQAPPVNLEEQRILVRKMLEKNFNLPPSSIH